MSEDDKELAESLRRQVGFSEDGKMTSWTDRRPYQEEISYTGFPSHTLRYEEPMEETIEDDEIHMDFTCRVTFNTDGEPVFTFNGDKAEMLLLNKYLNRSDTGAGDRLYNYFEDDQLVLKLE